MKGTSTITFDPEFGILEYFLEQKRLGRIRHLGFSCHGSSLGSEAIS